MSSHVLAARECLIGDRHNAEIKTVSELVSASKIFVEDGNHGENRPRQDEFCNQGNGIPFLRPPDLKEGRVDFRNCDFINAEGFARVRKGIGKPGDVILTHRATVGRIAITGSDAPNVFVTNPGTTIWRSLDKDLLDQRYLFFYMSSRIFQDRLFSEVGHTSTFDYVSLTQQRTLPVVIPEIRLQRQIAHILGTLDDKIELNRKTNETLEAMAKALFKSWFVDFDPVRAKAEGRPTGLPAEISNLFPDSFEDSELGEIPRGWGVAKIDQIIKIQKDSIDPSVTPDETFDHYSIPAFDSGKNPAKELGSSIKSQKFLVGDDDLLVSKLNPSTPRVWIPFSSSARRSICSTEFLVCRASTDVGRAFAYCLASSDSIIEVMTGLAGGTSNSHQRIRPSDFLSLECCIGSQKVRSAFSDVVEPLLRKTLAQRIESRSLASARDALLPKLISGEIRIPDAERMLEEVGV
jgi:type I restriction enzyme S subunit